LDIRSIDETFKWIQTRIKVVVKKHMIYVFFHHNSKVKKLSKVILLDLILKFKLKPVTLLSTLSYCVRIVMITTSLFALFNGLKIFKKSNLIKLFTLLILLSFLDGLSYFFLVDIFLKEEIFHEISPIIQGSYLYIEFITICIFFTAVLTNNLIKTALKGIIIIFTISVLFCLIIQNNPFTEFYLIFVITEVVIVNICFGMLMIKQIKYDTLRIQKFKILIGKGFFIFINLTAPYYVISDYLGPKYNQLTQLLNPINDIGYIILFFMFFKAFKWTQINSK